jgi:hypothetical protein
MNITFESLSMDLTCLSTYLLTGRVPELAYMSDTLGMGKLQKMLRCNLIYACAWFLLSPPLQTILRHSYFDTVSSERTSDTLFTSIVIAKRHSKLFELIMCKFAWPNLWSNGQSSRLQIQWFRFRFQALPDFLSGNGSVTGSVQPREDNWGATWKKK